MPHRCTFIFIVLSAGVLAGCCPEAEFSPTTTTEGAPIPLHLGVGLTNGSYIDELGRLRSDCLYCYRGAEPVAGGKTLLQWLRFWPNGRMISNTVAIDKGQLPTAADGDRWSKSTTVGRYCVEGNMIEIETVVVRGECWRYQTTFGTIRSDGTISLDSAQIDRGRPSESSVITGRIPQEFRPHIVGKMEKVPAW